MPRRPATITQADIARVIRAAKQAGAKEVEVRVGEGSSIIVRLGELGALNEFLAPSEEIVL
jgi:2-iminoacetate synthase ThiH